MMEAIIKNYLHAGDLPADIKFNGDIAIDTETKGLNILLRDRLCVVQMKDATGDTHLVQLGLDDYATAKNLKKALSDESQTKIFHYARFDVAVIKHYLGVEIKNIYCTKIASKLARTYTDKHGLKDICKELLNADISKQQQCSDWGAVKLSKEQIDYAASDVLHLHALRTKLDLILKTEGRYELAKQCFAFLPTRVELDLKGWAESDIFSHQ